MGDEDGSIEFFQPHRRALLPIEGIRVSRSLAKTIRAGKFEVRFDNAFERVMRGCRRPDENWINEPIIRVYCEIHREGWAHSCECYAGEELVGGLYGLALGRVFCAESMFHRHPNASKVALYSMVERCREMGFEMFDAQIMNPHLASLGAFEISHHEYMARLLSAVRESTAWSAR